MSEQATGGTPGTHAVVRRKSGISVVWIIPILAILVGAWVAYTRIISQGPEITMTFPTAEGLEAGKTKVHYNGVDVGLVTAIRLSDDHRNVILTVQMAPETERFLVADTKFWVVSPRISGANVSGLSTLISGAYIGVQLGTSTEKRRAFEGLPNPPVVSADTPGRFFSLTSADLGSLDTGSPIFFRRLQAGQVVSYKLNPDGHSLDIRIFVNAPYDQYVTPDTRFWNASGVDVSLSASGLNVQTESVLSILVGGIAFETPATGPVLAEAEAESGFTLHRSRADAFKAPPGNPYNYRVVFRESVRGLTVGSPVEFRGIPVGEVTGISAQLNAKTLDFSVPVTIQIDITRLGIQVVGLKPGEKFSDLHRNVIDTFVAKGLRAQLRKANLITGGLYVALDEMPNAPPARVDWTTNPPGLPTVPGTLEETEERVASILRKVDEMNLDQLGKDVHLTLTDLDGTLVRARTTLDRADELLGNASKAVAPGSEISAQINSTLGEVSEAARSVRVLTDYLEQHPESLIRGKPEEEKKQ